MPELNPKGYSKLLSEDDYTQQTVLNEWYEVVDDAGTPVPLKLTHYERAESVAELPDGYIVIEAVDFDDEDEAEALFEKGVSQSLKHKPLYDFIIDNYENMYEERVIGRIAFNIMPGPVSIESLNTVPRICGAYLAENYRRLRISPIGYQMIGGHYGAVQSDQEQTVLGAKLWYASLPRYGTVTAVDTHMGQILEELFHTRAPSSELWDGCVLIGTTEETELDSLGSVPYSRKHSKKHILLEFVPK
ncbi:hypothetical protein NMS34_000767 [Vibrio cholerae]|nr:hypothetical protein [Vibrio cholerae]EJL6627393.1 hypothetical protein [Vibrio cholerae]